MNQDYQSTVERLQLFLADTKGETRDEITNELRLAGVDVDKFIGDIKRITSGQKGFSRVSRFAAKSRDEILKLIAEYQVGMSAGKFAHGLATREQNDLNQLSDSELQSLLENIEARRSSDSK